MDRKATQDAPVPQATLGARMAMNGAMGMASKALGFLERIASAVEPETRYDTTFVVCAVAGTPAVLTVQLPRTVTYAEVEISGGVPTAAAGAVNGMAVFAGSVNLAEAAQQFYAAAATGPSNAIVASSGGRIKARDYLDQSGLLSVYFTDGGFANIRVTQLDGQQDYASRG